MRKRRSGDTSRRSKPGRVKARAKRYFGAVAGRWDRMREDFFDQAVAESVVKSSGVSPTSVVVDVGCGTGFLTREVALQTQGKARILGVDLSDSMLQTAKDNLAKLGLSESSEFRLGDAEDLPVEDDFADAVVGNMILHHCPNPRRAISEMARILKPGGRIALADLEKHNEKWLREEMADRWLGFDLRILKKWFEGEGLEDVRVDLARTKCCGISLQGRKAEIGIFIASGSRPKNQA